MKPLATHLVVTYRQYMGEDPCDLVLPNGASAAIGAAVGTSGEKDVWPPPEGFTIYYPEDASSAAHGLQWRYRRDRGGDWTDLDAEEMQWVLDNMPPVPDLWNTF